VRFDGKWRWIRRLAYMHSPLPDRVHPDRLGMTITAARMLTPVAVMSLLGFRTALSFGETLVAVIAAGLGWLAGMWLGGHALIGELLGLWVMVRRWA
jgi:hypothetical protein